MEHSPTGPSLGPLQRRYSREAARARGSLTPREALREEAMQFVCQNGIAGDYLEFGAYRGAGLIQAYWTNETFLALEKSGEGPALVDPAMLLREEFRAILRALRSRRFFAFDSFQGLSAPSEPEEALYRKGDFRCPVEALRRNLLDNGVPLERVVAVEGWFADTLNADTRRRTGLTAAAIVNVDCDLYQPAAQVLAFVTPLLVDGSVLLFDDWHLFRGHPQRGEQRAFREWRAEHPELIVTPFSRVNAFLVHHPREDHHGA